MFIIYILLHVISYSEICNWEISSFGSWFNQRTDEGITDPLSLCCLVFLSCQAMNSEDRPVIFQVILQLPLASCLLQMAFHNVLLITYSCFQGASALWLWDPIKRSIKVLLTLHGRSGLQTVIGMNQVFLLSVWDQEEVNSYPAPLRWGL